MECQLFFYYLQWCYICSHYLKKLFTKAVVKYSLHLIGGKKLPLLGSVSVITKKEEQMKRMSLVLVLSVIFCALVIPTYAAEKKPEIKDGAIHFPEDGLPVVELSKINVRIPADCPPELLSAKGKIFRGELIKTGVRNKVYALITYIIPVSYNSDTKDVTFLIVQDKGYGKDYESKSVQGWLKGPLDVANGTVLKWVLRAGTNLMTQDYKLKFQKNGNLRIDRTDGFSGDYVSVGTLPEENLKGDTAS
jgi:hypothetical protein